MPVNTVFQEVLDAHFAPPRWVRELDDCPPLPPVEMGNPMYDPYANKSQEATHEPIRD